MLELPELHCVSKLGMQSNDRIMATMTTTNTLSYVSIRAVGRSLMVALGLILAIVWCCVAEAATSERILFADPNLEAGLRETLGVSEGDLTRELLESLEQLVLWNRGITDLQGLEHCANLRVLDLSGNDIVDLRPLASLTELRTLNLYSNDVKDVRDPSLLDELAARGQDSEKYQGLRPIVGLSQLEILNLEGNYDAVADPNIFLSFPNLSELYLRSVAISDIEPLGSLSSLRILWFGPAGAANLQALSGLQDLESLVAVSSEIQDISPIAELGKLTFLSLGGNWIVDITPLAELQTLSELVLSGNEIADIGPLAGLPNLTAISLDKNRIVDISPLAGATSALRFLDLNDNRISDIGPLVANKELGNIDPACMETQRDFMCTCHIFVRNNLLDLSEGSADMLALEELSGRENVAVSYDPQGSVEEDDS